jgi:hypothetical protein
MLLILLIGVPRLGFGLEVPKFYKEIALENDIPLESKALEQILSTSNLKSDAIHPNAAGCRFLVESVEKMLLKSGAL